MWNCFIESMGYLFIAGLILAGVVTICCFVAGVSSLRQTVNRHDEYLDRHCVRLAELRTSLNESHRSAQDKCDTISKRVDALEFSPISCAQGTHNPPKGKK